jgi:hypothetical protein
VPTARIRFSLPPRFVVQPDVLLCKTVSLCKARLAFNGAAGEGDMDRNRGKEVDSSSRMRRKNRIRRVADGVDWNRRPEKELPTNRRPLLIGHRLHARQPHLGQRGARHLPITSQRCGAAESNRESENNESPHGRLPFGNKGSRRSRGPKVPIAVPRPRRECANNYRLFGQPWDFLGKRDFLGKAAQTHNQLCPAKISPTKSAICLTFVLTLTNFRLSEANRWIDSACS